ncbi:YnfA family protein [Actinoallomurus rhizosphaericola]|uniref:hypothetical protein n=1 Tax=Actinoallomurus rhizosphaericola TaxID=2952536 RepID=UPI00387313BA
MLTAYGDVFIAGSLVWGMAFDGFRPDRWDVSSGSAGPAPCLMRGIGGGRRRSRLLVGCSDAINGPAYGGTRARSHRRHRRRQHPDVATLMRCQELAACGH